jgi:hypothetical protein
MLVEKKSFMNGMEKIIIIESTESSNLEFNLITVLMRARERVN